MASRRVANNIERVRILLGISGSSAISDDDILLAMTLGQLELLQRLPDVALMPLCATASGVMPGDAVALPDDYVRCRLVICDSVVCRRVRVAELYLLSENSSLITQPHYYIWANNLNIVMDGGATGKTYVLHYLRRPQAITTDSEPELSAAYDRMLIDYAVALLAENRALFNVSEMYMARFIEGAELFASRAGSGLPADSLTGDVEL